MSCSAAAGSAAGESLSLILEQFSGGIFDDKGKKLPCLYERQALVYVCL